MRILLLVSALLFALVGCDDGEHTPAADAGAPTTHVAGVVEADARLATLHAALIRVGADARLTGAGPFTLFAPIDGAFAEIDLDALDDAAVLDLVGRHLVEGRWTAAELAEVDLVESVDGFALAVVVEADGLTVGGAPIQESDRHATNGVVHLMEAVIAAPVVEPGPSLTDRLAERPELSVFAELLAQTALATDLSDRAAPPVTVFAPTNDAFDALPAGALDLLADDAALRAAALNGHLVAGRFDRAGLAEQATLSPVAGTDLAVVATDDGLRVGGAQVLAPEGLADNGVLHGVDRVLVQIDLPPPPPGTIADELAADPRFATALTALNAYAPLAEQLADPEAELTVFAPTEAAFAELEAGTLEALLADPAALAAVLTLHVVEGTAAAADLAEVAQIDTLAGPVLVEQTDDGLRVGGALVLEADLAATNGRIHAIDAVLQPAPVRDLRGVLTADGRFETFLGALSTAELRFDGPVTVFAPTDAAFAGVALPDDPAELRALLAHHVVPTALDAAQLGARRLVRSQSGQRLRLTQAEALQVDAATVVAADLWVDEGVVHGVDAVLSLPPTTADWLAADGRFSRFLALVEAADLTALLAEPEHTVLAPTDAALADLPMVDGAAAAALVQLHLVEGDLPLADAIDEGARASLAEAFLFFGAEATVNGAPIESPDHPTHDGLVHVLGAALTPPADLVDVLAQAGRFTTLLRLLDVAGLTAGLRDPQADVALLAPTDAAFEALGADALAALEAEPMTLAATLRGHMLPGAPRVATLLGLDTVPALDGVSWPVALRPEGLFVGSARIGLTDLPAPNGLIHSVDTVLQSNLDE